MKNDTEREIKSVPEFLTDEVKKAQNFHNAKDNLILGVGKAFCYEHSGVQILTTLKNIEFDIAKSDENKIFTTLSFDFFNTQEHFLKIEVTILRKAGYKIASVTGDKEYHYEYLPACKYFHHDFVGKRYCIVTETRNPYCIERGKKLSSYNRIQIQPPNSEFIIPIKMVGDNILVGNKDGTKERAFPRHQVYRYYREINVFKEIDLIIQNQGYRKNSKKRKK